MSWEPSFLTGAERAEPSGLRRLLRQPSFRRNLTIAAAALGAALVLLPRGAARPPSAMTSFDPLPAPTGSAAESAAADQQPKALLGTPVPGSIATPVTAVGSDPVDMGAGTSNYAIYLYRLPGLAPDAAPGTRLDIWVTWKPPVTRRPKVQLLLEDVRLGGIESGFEEGPVADLVVDQDEVPDLIYGERFGSLTAVARTI